MNLEVPAVLVGLVRYLEEREETERTKMVPQAVAWASGASAWALHGRQSIMRMRALVQQRVLKR